MKFRTATLIAALVVAPLVAGTAAAQTDLKIGYVVTHRLLAETKAGQAAAEKLKTRLGSARKGLEEKAKEIQELEEDIQRRRMVLSDEEKKKVATEHERQMKEARRMREDIQAELKKVEAEVMEEVNILLREVIEDFGEAEGYDLILDAGALIYVSDKADLTPQLIKAADKAYK